jgi:hypothetical protein
MGKKFFRPKTRLSASLNQSNSIREVLLGLSIHDCVISFVQQLDDPIVDDLLFS